MSKSHDLDRRQIQLLELPFRSPTSHEAALLDELFSSFSDGEAAPFRNQLQGITVRQSCACGCPSISLQTRTGVHAISVENRVIIDGIYGTTSGGSLVGLILFTRDGLLHELEFYDVRGEIEGTWSLPLTNSLGRSEPRLI